MSPELDLTAGDGKLCRLTQVCNRGLSRHGKGQQEGRALPYDTDVPWWRVVNRLGEISLRAGDGPTLPEARLRMEQVAFDPRGRVDLDRFRWEECPD